MEFIAFSRGHILHEISLQQSTSLPLTCLVARFGLRLWQPLSSSSQIVWSSVLRGNIAPSPFPLRCLPLSPVDLWMYLTHKSFIASAIHPPSCVKHHFVDICIRRVSLQQPPNVLLESFGLVWDCWLLCFMTFKCVGLLSCLEWMLNGS